MSSGMFDHCFGNAAVNAPHFAEQLRSPGRFEETFQLILAAIGGFFIVNDSDEKMRFGHNSARVSSRGNPRN